MINDDNDNDDDNDNSNSHGTNSTDGDNNFIVTCALTTHPMVRDRHPAMV